MGFIAVKCPNCGAEVNLDESREFGFCTYCGTKVVQEKVVVEHRGQVSVGGISDEFDKSDKRATSRVSNTITIVAISLYSVCCAFFLFIQNWTGGGFDEDINRPFLILCILSLVCSVACIILLKRVRLWMLILYAILGCTVGILAYLNFDDWDKCLSFVVLPSIALCVISAVLVPISTLFHRKP